MTGQRVPLYGLDEFAALVGVPVRTLRYYLAEGLLPPPLGRGRGNHYDDAHLMRLRSLQHYRAMGLELGAIKRLFDSHYATEALNRGEYPPEVGFATEDDPAWDAPEPPATAWTRLELAPGLELHVSSRYRVPSAVALAQVGAELRALVGCPGEEESADGPD